MKKIYSSILVIFIAANCCNAQNIFPLPSGSVGIGTTTPATLFQVSSGQSSFLPAANTSTYGVDIVSSGSLGSNKLFRLGVSGLTNGFTMTQDASSNLRYAFENGNVGIGTTSPGFALDVLGLVNASGAATGAGVGTLQLQGAKSDTHGFTLSFDNASNFAALNNFYSGPLTFSTGNTERMRVDASGKVGIGTNSPDEALTVNGTVHSIEVNVTATVPPPDYVFNADYKLPTLPEVKAYVEKNHHLPEIPSAAEIEKNGLKLGEMNSALLKKVEELTLYAIEQKEKNDSQQKQIDQLTKKLNHLTKSKTPAKK